MKDFRGMLLRGQRRPFVDQEIPQRGICIAEISPEQCIAEIVGKLLPGGMTAEKLPALMAGTGKGDILLRGIMFHPPEKRRQQTLFTGLCRTQKCVTDRTAVIAAEIDNSADTIRQRLCVTAAEHHKNRLAEALLPDPRQLAVAGICRCHQTHRHRREITLTERNRFKREIRHAAEQLTDRTFFLVHDNPAKSSPLTTGVSRVRYGNRQADRRKSGHHNMR